MQLRQKNFFLNFFLLLPNSASISNIINKKATLIAEAFLNLRTLKNVVR